MDAKPLRIPCPMCQVVLRAPAEATGKRVKCKNCGHQFQAGITTEQIAEQMPPAFDADEADAFLVQREPVPPPPVVGPSITYVCDKCGRYGQAPAHNAGMVFACECGGEIRVPELATSDAEPTRVHRRAAAPASGVPWLKVFAAAIVILALLAAGIMVGARLLPSMTAENALGVYLQGWKDGHAIPGDIQAIDHNRAAGFILTRYEMGRPVTDGKGVFRFRTTLHFMTEGGGENIQVADYEMERTMKHAWRLTARRP